MPWRRDPSPYHVLVSELMLQQTQVARVIPKFLEFVRAFPTIEQLAAAPLAHVITQWQGLGYNRRAKYLHDSARMIVALPAWPATRDELMQLPGVGANTAGAIMAYAYNQPSVFIETNIRTVFIHEFFPNQPMVDDNTIIAYVEATLDHDNPREWYYALMDYGAHLKTSNNRLSQSKQHKKQSALRGSLREMRGWIIRDLTQHGPTSLVDMYDQYAHDTRVDKAVQGLVRDGLVGEQGGQISLTASELPS